MKLAANCVVLIALMAAVPAWSADQVPTTVARKVDGQTLVSPELPPARFRFADGFRYVGGQRFALDGPTDAEQHFFADADAQGRVRRAYWIQFEHKMPSNNGSYNYVSPQTAKLGGLSFLYDTKIYTDYAGLKPAPGSDVEKARALLAAHGLHLPKTAIRARMFHLPGTDKRSELMIIYLEALSPDKMPKDAVNEMPADDKYPELAQALLRHAQQSLKILPAR
jgi:hypothetical protein